MKRDLGIFLSDSSEDALDYRRDVGRENEHVNLEADRRGTASEIPDDPLEQLILLESNEIEVEIALIDYHRINRTNCIIRKSTK
jgi:hypothetical protein